MSARVLRIGTRGSALALAQAREVAAALGRACGAASELVVIRTEGDRSAAAGATLGSRVGVFVREIERALTEGRVDLAVHSMKDVPTALAEGTVVAAVPERADARDCVVSRSGAGLEALPGGSRIGTSSARRRAQILKARADLCPAPVRGNVDTRLRKVAEGNDGLEAVVLAAAGLARLGLLARATETLSMERFPTAAGQGALAVQARAADAEVIELARGLDHAPSRAAYDAERAFVRALGAGCRTPVAAHASVGGAALSLLGAVYAPDGSREIRGEETGNVAEAPALGERLAAGLASRGARGLLDLSRDVVA